MPVTNATAKIKKLLEDMTTESWLDANAINKMFRTSTQKQKLSELAKELKKATDANQSAAKKWQMLGQYKDTVLKLVGKSVGLG